MVDVITSKFVAHGKPNDRAEEDALLVVNTILETMGGTNLYVPLGLMANIGERDAVIRQEFTGHNHTELARRHGLSVQHVYRILKKEKAVTP